MARDILKIVGRNIKRLREERNLTQDELGILSKMDQRNVNSYEQGKINASILTLNKFAKALKADIAELFKPI